MPWVIKKMPHPHNPPNVPQIKDIIGVLVIITINVIDATRPVKSNINVQFFLNIIPTILFFTNLYS